MQRQNRGLGSLKQIAPGNNPLNIIPKVTFGTLQNNSNQAADVTYDGRWPITGADTAFPISDNLTWTRNAHTFKMGILREHERFGQARSSNFGGQFDFSFRRRFAYLFLDPGIACNDSCDIAVDRHSSLMKSKA